MIKDNQPKLLDSFRIRIYEAVNLAFRYGNIEGGHHRKWVINEMLKCLLGEEVYRIRVLDYEKGEDGLDTYEWDTGIAP